MGNTYQPKCVFDDGTEFYLDDPTIKNEEFSWYSENTKLALSGVFKSDRIWGKVRFILEFPYHDKENERKVRYMLNTKGFFNFFPDKSAGTERYRVKVELSEYTPFYANDKYLGYTSKVVLVGEKNFISGSITVLDPNGGEVIQAMTTYNILWSSTGSISKVDILFSGDGGSNYSALIEGTDNDGVWQWGVLEGASTHCLIKIQDHYNPPIYDVSDAEFTIQWPI